MKWLRRWCGRVVECHEMRDGDIPCGEFPWLVVGEKIGAQVVVDFDGWQVGCSLAGLVSDVIYRFDGEPDQSAELLPLAEAFEAEAKRIRECLKHPIS